jgi:hypothetical protein
MPPPTLKDDNKDTSTLKSNFTAAKTGAAQAIQSSKTDAKAGEPSSRSPSSTDDRGLTKEQAALVRLKDEHSTLVYDKIISHLDWDDEHEDRIPKPAFVPFYLFCSTELRKEKPELEKLVTNLKTRDASRKVGGKGVETGVAWKFHDEDVARQLQEGVKLQKPAIYLGYDMVTVGGRLRPCQVACKF